MLFNSLEFVAFLAVVGTFYHCCPLCWRHAYLLAASLLFYATWSLPFAGLLLGITAAAFVTGQRITAASTEAVRRRTLTVGVLLLVSPLAVFKYFCPLLGALGGVAAPIQFVGAVGLSYYTMKLISYVVDVHWERRPACRSFPELATYAAFFPQILSGPIQRPGPFMAQMESLAPVPPEMIASGLRLLLFGFFKKLVVADRLGITVDQIFTHPQEFSGPLLALGCYLFTWQLYADFSGLTDIAIGSARLFGIRSPRNFDAPFFADTIQDFWRRWHMTLTNWLADYVFTPLRMTLRDWGSAGLIASLTINMVVIGIWHGASWTFLVFGLLHAAYMIGSTVTWRERRRLLQTHPLLQGTHAVVGPLVTFHMLAASLILFRAATVADAWHIFTQACDGLWRVATAAGHLTPADRAGWGRLHWNGGDIGIVIWGLAVMEIVHILQRQGKLQSWANALPGWVRWSVYYALGFAILLWGESDSRQFIYVRF